MGFTASTAMASSASTAAGASGASGAGGFGQGLAQFSTASNVGGAVSTALGAYYDASMQKQSAKHTAAMATINARVAELGAQSALLQGKSEVAKLTQQAGRLKSTQKARLAANGVDLGVGNAAEIQASTDIMKEIDTNTIQSNAWRSAWGHRVQAQNYLNQADAARITAKGINPYMSAANSLMGDSGQVASQWYGLQQQGAFGTTTDAKGNTTNSWW